MQLWTLSLREFSCWLFLLTPFSHCKNPCLHSGVGRRVDLVSLILGLLGGGEGETRDLPLFLFPPLGRDVGSGRLN